MLEFIVTGAFLLLGLALWRLIHRVTRPEPPRLDSDERLRLLDYVSLAVDGVQELSKGNLVVTDRRLYWQPNRVPMMSGGPVEIPLSEISGLELGKRVWWAAFGQPIVIQTPGHTLRVFLEGRYFEQVFDARRQKRWIEAVSQLTRLAVTAARPEGPVSDEALSLKRRFIERREAAMAVAALGASLIVGAVYALTGIPSGFSLFVLLLGAFFVFVSLIVALRQLFSSRGAGVRMSGPGPPGAF